MAHIIMQLVPHICTYNYAIGTTHGTYNYTIGTTHMAHIIMQLSHCHTYGNMQLVPHNAT